MALEKGRLLVGNERGAAALEMLSLGGRFRAGEKPLLMALTGTEFVAHIGARQILPLCSFVLQAGQAMKSETLSAASGWPYLISTALEADVCACVKPLPVQRVPPVNMSHRLRRRV